MTIFSLQKDQFGLTNLLESDQIHIAGLVVGDYCEDWNHWEGTQSLSKWLLDQGIPGIQGMRSCVSMCSYPSIDTAIDANVIFYNS